MTEHNGLPVSGYAKTQSEARVQLVNANKLIEEQVLRILDTLKDDPEIDQRWLATGRTDIEKGFMAVNRAIFRNGRVKLPGDPDAAPAQ
jgi:hypothetical protein